MTTDEQLGEKDYTCPTECVETNHPGMEHRQWLPRDDEERAMRLIEAVRPYWSDVADEDCSCRVPHARWCAWNGSCCDDSSHGADEAHADCCGIEKVVSDALDPILAEYVGPPIPHEAVAIVLDMAQRAVVAALSSSPGANDGE